MIKKCLCTKLQWKIVHVALSALQSLWRTQCHVHYFPYDTIYSVTIYHITGVVGVVGCQTIPNNYRIFTVQTIAIKCEF